MKTAGKQSLIAQYEATKGTHAVVSSYGESSFGTMYARTEKKAAWIEPLTELAILELRGLGYEIVSVSRSSATNYVEFSRGEGYQSKRLRISDHPGNHASSGIDVLSLQGLTNVITILGGGTIQVEPTKRTATTVAFSAEEAIAKVAKGAPKGFDFAVVSESLLRRQSKKGTHSYTITFFN